MLYCFSLGLGVLPFISKSYKSSSTWSVPVETRCWVLNLYLIQGMHVVFKQVLHVLRRSQKTDKCGVSECSQFSKIVSFISVIKLACPFLKPFFFLLSWSVLGHTILFLAYVKVLVTLWSCQHCSWLLNFWCFPSL